MKMESSQIKEVKNKQSTQQKYSSVSLVITNVEQLGKKEIHSMNV